MISPQIILIFKPGKPNVLTFYRPINLLPPLHQTFLKAHLKRLFLMVENYRLIMPNHQFGFRQRYSTIEQTSNYTKDK
jgi:hypothetical protein